MISQRSSAMMNLTNKSTNELKQKANGFSLVELLISMTLGLFIVGIVIMALITASSGARTNQHTAELQMNVQNTLQIIKRDIQHAGFRGITGTDLTSAILDPVVAECAPGFVANFRQGVWGADDTNPFGATCIPAAKYSANTDIIAIRHLGLNPVLLSDLTANTVYFTSAYTCGQIFVGTTPPVCNDTTISYYPFETSVYFISPCTDNPCEAVPQPSLYRARLSGGLSMANQELLVSGVESMQIQYGRVVNGNINFLMRMK